MDVGEITATLTANTDEWSAKMSSAAEDVVKLGAVAGTASAVATSALELLGEGFKKLSEIIPEAAKHATEYAHEIDLVAQKTGLTTTYIQSLIPALHEVGLTTENLAMGFRKLAQDISAAEAPASKQAAMFRELGLSAKLLSDPGEALSLISERLAAMPDSFEKTRLAGELMGRTGLNLIPILNEGAEGFERSRQKAIAYGLSLSGPAMESLKKLHDAQKDNELAADGLSTRLGIAFAPLVTLVTQAATTIKTQMIPAIDQMGISIQMKLAFLSNLFGFLRAQAQLSVTDINGLMVLWDVWNSKSEIEIANAKKLGEAIVEAAKSEATAVADKLANHDKQLAADEALRISTKATGDLQEWLGTNILAELIVHYQFLEEAKKKAAIQDANEMVAQIALADSIDRGLAGYKSKGTLLEQQVYAIRALEELMPNLIGEEASLLAIHNQQAGQSVIAEEQMQHALAVEHIADLQKQIAAEQASFDVQKEYYKMIPGLIGQADNARQSAFNLFEAEEQKRTAVLDENLRRGEIDQATYNDKILNLDRELQSKRLAIIREYPTFVEKQLQDLEKSNAFSLSQIVTSFTSSMAKMIVEGGKLKQFWISLQETLVQAALNTGIQMLANYASYILKMSVIDDVAQKAKIAMIGESGTEEIDARKLIAEGAGMIEESTAAAGIEGITATGEAALAAADIVVGVTASIFEAIAAALELSVVGSEMAPAFADAGAAVGIAGGGAVTAGQDALAAMNSIALESVLGSVPQLAAGGIVDHATLLVAGEQGPEAIIPLDKAGGLGGGTQEISIYLDGGRSPSPRSKECLDSSECRE